MEAIFLKCKTHLPFDKKPICKSLSHNNCANENEHTHTHTGILFCNVYNLL